MAKKQPKCKGFHRRCSNPCREGSDLWCEDCNNARMDSLRGDMRVIVQVEMERRKREAENIPPTA
jgi:cold shock CspA family protein